MKGVAVGMAVGGASVLLLKVKVTQADGQAGVIGLTAEGRGAHCGERARAQAVGRHDLTVWKERGERSPGQRESQSFIEVCFD